MSNKAIPLTVKNTVLICEYINKLGMSPKEFMVTFLSSTHKDVIYRQRISKIGKGARETRSIFKNLARLTTASDTGHALWEGLILEEVRAFPSGAFVSSTSINPDFFGDTYEELRTAQVKSGMKFLHTLIHCKIAHAMKKGTLAEGDDVAVASERLQSPSQDPLPRESKIEGALDEETVLSMDNMVSIKQTATNQADHKLAKVNGILLTSKPCPMFSLLRGFRYPPWCAQ
ncbi:hypothetical protein DFH28DRAFT_898544 [Melampsora americana]|nr:hypothetical protein DFH28DRAFT_898544 [Melampsora americana]